jgi:hypothetical protein
MKGTAGYSLWARNYERTTYSTQITDFIEYYRRNGKERIDKMSSYRIQEKYFQVSAKKKRKSVKISETVEGSIQLITFWTLSILFLFKTIFWRLVFFLR